eukprot:TRINITY_DN192_c0_g1_i5.p3 TRINITY_DN192_c0_g1~~TRINITY_DN192_c0_g1_i5.p3  ORF type:complete len:130 (-),score=28.58 TRINITY_DN192_c0_g1_i5:26-415(-)
MECRLHDQLLAHQVLVPRLARVEVSRSDLLMEGDGAQRQRHPLPVGVEEEQNAALEKKERNQLERLARDEREKPLLTLLQSLGYTPTSSSAVKRTEVEAFMGSSAFSPRLSFPPLTLLVLCTSPCRSPI